MLYPCQEDRNERNTEIYTISDKLANQRKSQHARIVSLL